MGEQEPQQKSEPAKGVSRRTLARGAKWAVPALTVGAAAPIIAASGTASSSFCTSTVLANSFNFDALSSQTSTRVPTENGVPSEDIKYIASDGGNHLVSPESARIVSNSDENAMGSIGLNWAGSGSFPGEVGNMDQAPTAMVPLHISTGGVGLIAGASIDISVGNVYRYEKLNSDNDGVIDSTLNPSVSVELYGSSVPAAVTYSGDSFHVEFSSSIPVNTTIYIAIKFDFTKLIQSGTWKYEEMNWADGIPGVQYETVRADYDVKFNYAADVTGSGFSALGYVASEVGSILVGDAQAQLSYTGPCS